MKNRKYFDSEAVGKTESEALAEDFFASEDKSSAVTTAEASTEGTPSFEDKPSVVTEESEEKNTGKNKKKKLIIALSIGAVALLIAAFLLVFLPSEVRLTLNGDSHVVTEVHSGYTDEGISAIHLWRDISKKAVCTSSVDTDCLGDYTVKYSVDYLFRHYEIIRDVTVQDTTAPVITLTESENTIISSMAFYTEPGFAAYDNYDGDITEGVSVEYEETDGKCTVRYRAVDSSGNSAGAERELEIRDIVPPVVLLWGDSEVTINTVSYNDPLCLATDDLDGDISSAVTVGGDYVTGTKGDFTLEYTAVDSAGNVGSATRILHVVDTTGPSIKLNGTSKVTIFEGDGYTDAGAVAYDDFDGDVSQSITSVSSVNPDAPGKYYVTYSAVDAEGNTSSASRTVVVSPRPVKGGGGEVSASTIYLTFDDGPSSSVTPRILDILAAYNVKATFFITGYSDEKRAIVARAIAEGHTIAIHGYSHDYAKIYSSDEAFVNNVVTLQNKLISDFGYNTNIMRFPGGSSNGVSKKYSKGIMTRLCPLMESMGFKYFDWNVSSEDASGNNVPASTISNSVIKGLKHGRGNIVLMHDSGAKSTTAAALSTIIEYGINNGYTFAALSADTPPVHHSIIN